MNIESYIGFTITDKDMPIDGPIFTNLEEVGIGETIIRCKTHYPNEIIINADGFTRKTHMKKYLNTVFKHMPNCRVIFIDAFTTEVVYDETKETWEKIEK